MEIMNFFFFYFVDNELVHYNINFFQKKKYDDYLMDSMILYIKKEIAAKFGTKSIIDDFRDLKEC